MFATTTTPAFWQLLRCPCCAEPTPLTYQAPELECANALHRFPLIEGIPDLRPETLKAPTPSPSTQP